MPHWASKKSDCDKILGKKNGKDINPRRFYGTIYRFVLNLPGLA